MACFFKLSQLNSSTLRRIANSNILSPIRPSPRKYSAVTNCVKYQGQQVNGHVGFRALPR